MERDSNGVVEQLLEDARYGDDLDYVPSPEAAFFVNIIKLIEGGKTENKTPVVHYKLLDNILSGKQSIAVLSHRGISKSTFMEYLIWYLAVFGSIPNYGDVEFAIYVSDSIENGVKTMRVNLDRRYERSKFLQQNVPFYKSTENRILFENKEGGRFTLRLYGALTGVRGAREDGMRPTLAILDDLIQKEEDARSTSVMNSINSTVYSDIEDAMHPSKKKTIWLGTPFNQQDPLYVAIESGAWSNSVFPVCEKYPCSREDFNGSWEDRFTYDAIAATYKKRKAAGQIDKFYRELMLQIKSDEDRLIQNADIQFIGTSTEYQANLNYYIMTDFATSEKAKADYSVLSVWALTGNKEYVLVEGICKKQLMDKNIEDLIELVRKYKPAGVGIEITGQQGGFIQWVKQELLRNDLFANILGTAGTKNSQEGVRPTKDKLSRFNNVVPLFKQGKIKFSNNLEPVFTTELKNELKNVTKSGIKSSHDDILDTISMLLMVDLIFPLDGFIEEENAVDYIDTAYNESTKYNRFFEDSEEYMYEEEYNDDYF